MNLPLHVSDSRPELVLASMSPRRRELLALGGWSFAILPADIDETPLPGEKPQAYVRRLAATKARVAAEEASLHYPGLPLVASDTAVVDGTEILGKPADAADATRMLRRLRGHAHQVFTALAVLDPRSETWLEDVCITDVPMRNYSDLEIDAYVATGDPLDKAGAYAIQHPVFKPVERLHGCYPSVMGLPLCHLARLLSQIGLPPRTGITRACLIDPDAPCDVFLFPRHTDLGPGRGIEG